MYFENLSNLMKNNWNNCFYVCYRVFNLHIIMFVWSWWQTTCFTKNMSNTTSLNSKQFRQELYWNQSLESTRPHFASYHSICNGFFCNFRWRYQTSCHCWWFVLSVKLFNKLFHSICKPLGTYIYTEKSASDQTFQRKTYTDQKKRNLVKPMFIVSTTG